MPSCRPTQQLCCCFYTLLPWITRRAGLTSNRFVDRKFLSCIRLVNRTFPVNESFWATGRLRSTGREVMACCRDRMIRALCCLGWDPNGKVFRFYEFIRLDLDWIQYPTAGSLYKACDVDRSRQIWWKGGPKKGFCKDFNDEWIVQRIRTMCASIRNCRPKLTKSRITCLLWL